MPSESAVQQRLDAVRRNAAVRQLAAMPHDIRKLRIRAVHHDKRDRAVRVAERRLLQLVRVTGAADAHRARTDITAEMRDIVERDFIDDFILHGVGNDRRVAEIAHMVRAALLVEHDVPIRPSGRPVVQVAENVMAVTLSRIPGAEMDAAFLTAFASFWTLSAQISIPSCL